MNSQETEFYLENPDKQKVYHVWHYCRKCFKVYTHSQNDFNELKKRECCSDPAYLVTISTKMNRVPINTAMIDYF